MSRSLALCSDQSAVYRRDLGKVIVRRAGMPLRRKPRRQESALYLHLLADSDIHLPVFRSADLHRRTTIATSASSLVATTPISNASSRTVVWWQPWIYLISNASSRTVVWWQPWIYLR